MSESSIRKLKKRALDLIRMGDKVYHYRKDILPISDLQTLSDTTAQLELLYKNKLASDRELEDTLEQQHEILVKTGGKIYPNRFLSENLETILVVAIVIIAFRIFFFQPFVIPTNSMYPTYSGMQSQTYEVGEKSPGLIKKVASKLLRGGSHYEIVAQNDGEILIPINYKTQSIDYRIVPGRKWFVFPALKKQFVFYIDTVPHQIKVPAEFNLDQAVIDAFSITRNKHKRYERRGNQILLKTGIQAKRNKPALQFDILMGDALFVNRMWYHFAKPKSGDAIVFRTADFMLRDDYPENVGEDKFYIKRLTGEPGQTLEVIDYRLYQDGEPASGAKAFEKNANQEGEYPGYRNRKLLTEGKTFTVPEDHYFAMGDNSTNSKDSRYFGPVPKKNIIGAASFIYYPFTKRWGPAE